jgi:hypothetical protein
VDHAPFIDYNWASTNFRKSTSTLLEFFTVIGTKGLNKLECLSLAKPFQLSLIFGSKAGAYPSGSCPIYRLHLGMKKL